MSATPKSYNVIYDPEIGLQYEYPSGYIPVPVGGGGTPGGADTQVQYNNVGSFAGSSAFTFQTVGGTIPFLSLNSDGQTTLGFSSADNLTQFCTLSCFGATAFALSHPNLVELVASGVQLNVLAPGKVVIGTEPSVGDTSAVLEVRSTTKGFLPPVMTTDERDAITSPAEGLEIYNLDTHTKNFWNGTVWKVIATV